MVRPTEIKMYIISNKKIYIHTLRHQYKCHRERESITKTFQYIQFHTLHNNTRAQNQLIFWVARHNWTELNIHTHIEYLDRIFIASAWMCTIVRVLVCVYVWSWCQYGLNLTISDSDGKFVCVYRKRVHKINLHTFRTVNGSLPLQPQLQNI